MVKDWVTSDEPAYKLEAPTTDEREGVCPDSETNQTKSLEPYLGVKAGNTTTDVLLRTGPIVSRD